jgi:hypothetical protein
MNVPVTIADICAATAHVRFESEADICAAQRHVRVTPNSDRKSEIPHKVMSAFPPKADMCSARAHVCFVPKVDIASLQESKHIRTVIGP